MPIDASSPRISGSTASSGSSWTTAATCSKYDASLAKTASIGAPDIWTKSMAGVRRRRQGVDAEAGPDAGYGACGSPCSMKPRQNMTCPYVRGRTTK